jgi:hypothetical protein
LEKKGKKRGKKRKKSIYRFVGEKRKKGQSSKKRKKGKKAKVRSKSPQPRFASRLEDKAYLYLYLLYFLGT